MRDRHRHGIVVPARDRAELGNRATPHHPPEESHRGRPLEILVGFIESADPQPRLGAQYVHSDRVVARLHRSIDSSDHRQPVAGPANFGGLLLERTSHRAAALQFLREANHPGGNLGPCGWRIPSSDSHPRERKKHQQAGRPDQSSPAVHSCRHGYPLHQSRSDRTRCLCRGRL